MSNTCSHQTRPLLSGFSLVELAIVLVILGLLVGGVLSGKSLIHASELRGITTERNNFYSAIYAFRDKYLQLPGDLNNAYQFWGATCGTDTATASTGCNGNGGGTISLTNGEAVNAWEHLSRAGLISGSYDGTGVVSVGQVRVSTTNSPASKYTNMYWGINEEAAYHAGGGPVGLYLHLGPITGLFSYVLASGRPGIARDDAWNIDTKLDDGKANTGKMRGENVNSCSDGGSDYYSVAAGADTKDCTLNFDLQ